MSRLVVWSVMGLSGLPLSAVNADWVSLTSPDVAAPRIEVIEPGPQHVILEFDLPGFETEELTIDGQAFTRIALPGYPPLLKEGWPELPTISRSLIVSDEGLPHGNIVARKLVEIPMDPVVPSKGNLPRTIDPGSVPYAMGSFYSGGTLYPELEFELTSPFILRDHRGVTVRIYPFRYDAQRGVLLVLQSLTLEIVTSGTGGTNVKQRVTRPAVDHQFQRIYDQFFLNSDSGAKYQPITDPGPMLVVCDDAFLGQITPFVVWKEQKGIPVDVVATSVVGGTVDGIQSAIDNRYYSPAGLTYVVLVGDIEQVPTHIGTLESAASDPTYGMVEGDDFYPDLFVSRLSAQNPTQVALQVTKFIRYERDPDLDGDWYHMATGIASNQGNPTDIERCEWLRDDLLAYTFSHVDQIYQGQGGSTEAITTVLNEGRSLVNYLGHGTGNSWTNVYFGNAEVHALQNGWAHPWILDVSCSNGDFTQSECFAEAWLRAGSVSQPTGAMAIFSSSTQADWVPPTVMQAHAVDLLVTDAENSIGALCFAGSMHTLDTYPLPGTEGLKLMEQYNIFGDCSLVVRTDTPAAMTVEHQPVFPLGLASFSLDVIGIAEATACLYRDGIIHGTAVTDAAGHAEIVLTEPVQTPGEIKLTVTAYNHAPYQADIFAVVPPNVTIDPGVIEVDPMTPVTVTVTDTLGIGIPNLTITIEGYGVTDLVQITNSSGQAQFDIDPLYGEILTVRGRENSASYDLFGEPLLVVGAPDLTAPSILAEVQSIGLVGALTPDYPGNVIGRAYEADLTLFLQGAGVDTSGSNPMNSVVLSIVPSELGTMTAALAKIGYKIFTSEIMVIEAYGNLAGFVYEEGGAEPIGGARIFGYAAGADTTATPPIFDPLTGSDGAFTVPDSLPVGFYDLYAVEFGYLPYSSQIFLQYGDNSENVFFTTAPDGILSGTVTSSMGGTPLAAIIKLYRSDTGELITEATTDTNSGFFSSPPVPYYDYTVTVQAWHFIMSTVTVDINAPIVTQNFVLEPTVGNLLILNGSTNRGHEYPAKLGQDGTVIAAGYRSEPSRAAGNMVTDLETLGYSVVLEDGVGSDPDTWPNYDLLIFSGGSSSAPLDDETLRHELELFVGTGGHLLIEGGEIAYDSITYPGYPSFAANVLHVVDWIHDDGGNVTVADSAHAIMAVPNIISGPIAMSFDGYTDKDVVTVAPDAQLVGSWTSYPSEASVVAFDTNPAPHGGQIVFYPFNYSAMDSTVRSLLLQNCVIWLTTPEFNNSSIAGSVTLYGESDHSGVLVELLPTGENHITDATGAFSFTSLYAGSYQVIASKDGWEIVTSEFSLGEGEHLSDVDLVLAPMTLHQQCRTPGLVIQQFAAILDTLVVALPAPIYATEVFIDISHPDASDLIIDLISPQGTTVRLHNRTSGTAGGLYGWYPDELNPHGNLDDFLGEDADGHWVLSLYDYGTGDTGTLNQWCLQIVSPLIISDVDDNQDLPQDPVLVGNFPNPFNPRTQIKFSLPRVTLVDLAVYDIRGRKITSLIHEFLPPGHHSVTWQGNDESGRQVSSGLYFYRLMADGQGVTRKMLLLK